MNRELFLTIAVVFISGFIYSMYNIYQSAQNAPVIDTNIRQQQEFRNQQQRQQQLQQQQSQDNAEPIEILIQINQERKRFTVNLTDNIGQFMTNHIKPLIDNRDANLIFQGRPLTPSMPFSSYPTITNGTVLLCILRNANSQNDNENGNANMYNQPNQQSSSISYPIGTSVSFYTILTHGMISIGVFGLIVCYKSCKELFTPSTLILVQLLVILWAYFFSKTLACLFYYKTIVY